MKLEEISHRYREAKHRLLLLDYDGVLVPIVARPEDAVPSSTVLELLRRLSDEGQTTVVVISGRPHEALEAWLGDLPIEFVAEHGVWRRDKTGTWHMMIEPNEAHIAAANNLLLEWSHRFTGTSVESKRVGVAFHYRQSVACNDADATRLIEENRVFFEKNALTPIHGKKVIELVPKGVDKGSAARYWLDDETSRWDFVMAAGDDTTDEALFAALHADDISIHVGDGPTEARLSVDTQGRFQEFLSTFLER